MDLAYWGFSHWPFQRRQTGDAVIGVSHDEAYARLLFVIDEQRRCGSLMGPRGTGKSRLFRRAADYARRQGRICIAVDAAGMDAVELMQLIADQMHVDSHGASSSVTWSRIQQQLANRALVRQSTVVLIDNIDSAHRDCGQVLRRLMNLAESLDAALTVLVFSKESVASPELQEQIELSIELSGWSRNETAQFVANTTRTAGAKREIFTLDAIALIQDLTQGIPADVIRICDLALLAAMSDDRREVDAALVQAAIAEFSPRHAVKADPRSFAKQERAGAMVSTERRDA
jgi:general secretion pathway protein A